ncbi:hypothetical protein [Marinovum sp.]|uniref:hypothetical protein n=1 Tax=Marinovum sp. TaxID=2024839 RepID=UPI002B2761FE|nr:hypothetical protein [Marinovum sp.]
MADIEELQRRLTAAIDRIGKGVEQLDATGAPPVDPGDLEALQARLDESQAALEEERLAGRQREERIKTLHAKLEDAEATMKARMDAQSEATAQVDLELQRLRKANAQLRDNNRALREANKAGLADPHLINTGMIAELEALNAARAAETAEAEAIAAAFKQLLPGDAPREDA